MRLFREILRDTRAIARSIHGEAPAAAAVARTLFHDGAQVLALSRLRAAAQRRGVPLVASALRRLQIAFYGIDIGSDVTLGEGVIFSHTVGIVIGGDAKIGDHVMFLGSNTVGSIRRNDFPRIGDNVIIGAGARILGAITVGDKATIGANAVVVRDVPAGAIASGVPAQVRGEGAPESSRRS